MNTNPGIPQMNGANMPMNPGNNMGVPMNPAMSMNSHNMSMNNMPMNMNMNNINPSILAAFQNPQNSQNGMMAKFPNYQASQQSIPPSTPNLGSTQGQGQSISPSQLMSASPSQLMAQQLHSQGSNLTLTPAQLLQQQQGGMNQASMGTMHPGMSGMAGMNMGAGGMQNLNIGNAMPNINGGAMNMPTGMQNMSANMGMSNMMSGMPNLSNPQVRMPITPQRWSQMSPQDRALFQQQRHQLGLAQPPSAPNQQHHERGPSLTHDRPPSQHGRHDRASSQSHDRQPSQQPQDISQVTDRPSSSASICSHHSHHNLDSGLMPPPSSRPGTSSSGMGVPNVNPRMNQQSMNLNPHLNMPPSANINPNMNASSNINPHMNQASNINPVMNPIQAQQNMNSVMHMNMAPSNINPVMNQVQNMNMNPHLNHPPTRADSAHGLAASPKQSPRMSGMMNLAGGPPGGMPGSMGGQINLGMTGMPSGGMGMHGAPMSGAPGGGMNMSMGGNMSTAMGTMGNAGVGSMGNVPSMGGMGNLGSVNMNANTIGGLGAGGSMLGGAGGGLMGPPVIPQSIQRPEREQMMQRERSSSLHAREQSIPPASAAPFMGQSLDNASIQGLGNMSGGMGGMPRQQSQPPINTHQQSPARQIPSGHRSPMPLVRKAGEIPATPALSGTPNPAAPHPGAATVPKLPPHLAGLNPAVTKISLIPYTVHPKPEATTDGEDEKVPVEGATDSEDAVTSSQVKVEDPVKLLTPSEITMLKEIMKRDTAYDALHRTKQTRMAQELRTHGPASRSAWWERDHVPTMGMNRRPERFDVRYPRAPNADRGSNINSRKKGVRREGIRIPRKLPPQLANRPEQLVPIRLEFDVEHHKMRETFVWNLNDPVITPEHFAQTLVEDYALPQSYHGVITRAIQEQLSDFKAHIARVDGDWKPPSSAREMALTDGYKADEEDGNDADMRETDADDIADDYNRKLLEDDDLTMVDRGSLDDEDVKWWESWRKRSRQESAFTRSISLRNQRKRRKVTSVKVEESDAFETDKEIPHIVDEIEIDEKTVHEDLRILIKLDIIVGSMKLDDQFEWDLENVDASPEQFADVYVKELGLGGEFKTAIAHCIREQVQIYQKSLFLVGHPSDGSTVQDDDLRMSFLPSLASGARAMDQVPSFTPLLNYLSDGEIERSEKEREKELTKRRKRNTRGRRGIALPDREPNRTYRTPALGFPELDAATLALAAANAPTTSRRAAAAAASLTIANMVASENGTSVMPLQLPPQQIISTAVTAGKEKKPKGLFKAPSYPSSVLRPRAQVTTPTPSTAVESTSMLPSSFLDTEAPASTVSIPAPDSRAVAKKAKELEREAKEKEFVDGQHANVINGVWHCSNCGCPDSVAIGRRKGPLGDKSQCGTCGKFWHRHRRPRPVTYNQDPDYHLSLRRETEQVKTGVKRKGRAPNSQVATDGQDTPSRQKLDLFVDISTRLPVPASEDDRAMSPVSTASSDTEAPLAQRVTKVNGANHAGVASSSGTPAPTSNGIVRPKSPRESSAPLPNGSYAPPPWLTTAIRSLQEQYPDDKFEAILRRAPPRTVLEWRMKCLDCPGKLYNSGPGDTLQNYEVHLRNRQHRLRVNSRLTQAPAS